MIGWVEAVTLALVQGLTEFLPVSSSAHLILVPMLTGWQDQGLAFDVAVHVGTLMAVCLYFRQEIARLTGAWLGSLQGKPATPYSRLAWQLLLATVPVVIAGLLFHDYVATVLRSPLMIAGATIVFGLLLAFSDQFHTRNKTITQLSFKESLLIGLAQILSLVPGTSRSGITLTAGLSLGLNRADSARFSFLLAIPVIILAGGYEGMKVMTSQTTVYWPQILLGMSLAFVSAYCCIHAFLKLIGRMGAMPFVIYRCVLGVGLLILFW